MIATVKDGTGARAALGARVLLGLAGFGVWFGACVIPERKYDAALDPDQVIAPNEPAVGAADAGDDGGQPVESTPCAEYCDEVMNRCEGSAAVYASADECLAICRRVPEGIPGETGVNSVQCRLSELRRVGGFEPSDCSDVGPVSIDGTCGEPCQAFCELQSTTCGDAEATYCSNMCQEVLTKGDTYDITSANADTLQCRLINLVRAAASGAAPESCEQARVAPLTQEFSCQDGPTFPVTADREYYCDLMDFSCQGDDAVYDNRAQCLAVSALFETGTPEAFRDNTLRCRRLHAYYSLGAAKAMHCRHAGPTGDGQCGSNCESYCRILARGCPDAFNGTFATTEGVDAHTACVADCEAEDSGLPDARTANAFGTVAPFYSVNAEPPPGTLKCRALNAVRAVETPDDPQLCTAALGAADSPCAPLN